MFTASATGMTGGTAAYAGASAGGSYTTLVYTPGGGKLATYTNGSLVAAEIPLPGGGTAMYNAAGLNTLRHADWLGSSRLATTWAHAVYSKTAYAPFGETYNTAGSPDASFTGEDADTASGAYNFLFRKLDPVAGRWLSPDPSGLAYADPTNPQSLNLYVYVRNNPLTNLDPAGLDCLGLAPNGVATVYSGDCPGEDPNNEYYYDCGDGNPDGCLYNNAATITALLYADGNLQLLYKNDGTNVNGIIPGFGYTPSVVWNGTDASINTDR